MPADRPRVLLVDDDLSVRQALAFYLELEGFEVVALESGEALLKGNPPPDSACIVLDLRLPGLDGLEALALLRRREVNAPALLITTQPKRSTRARAAAAGVAIVEKPLLGDQLVQAIRGAIAGSA